MGACLAVVSCSRKTKLGCPFWERGQFPPISEGLQQATGATDEVVAILPVGSLDQVWCAHGGRSGGLHVYDASSHVYLLRRISALNRSPAILPWGFGVSLRLAVGSSCFCRSGAFPAVFTAAVVCTRQKLTAGVNPPAAGISRVHDPKNGGVLRMP